jgi:2,3-bisphosphoglycerate-dependent phosphoglycerate mutase
MYIITLLRHGESEGNLFGVLQGQSDYSLTSTGIEQARQLAVKWKFEEVKFDLIISSPLKRAYQTAEIIAASLNTPIQVDLTWMERNFGVLQGKSLKEIDEQTPAVDFFHPYDSIGETGESQLDLYARACQAIQSLLRLTPGSYLVVSHGGILNKALYAIMGITPQGHYNSPIFHFGNAAYAQFRFNNHTRQWAVCCLNNQLNHSLFEGNNHWKSD